MPANAREPPVAWSEVEWRLLTLSGHSLLKLLGVYSVQIVEDDSYEGAAAEYQYQLISLLDFVLKKYKMPLEARQEICGEYAFDSGMLHDQGEIKSNRVEYEPMVAFKHGDRLLVRNQYFQFHEYAFGNSSEYFETDGS